MTLFKEIQQLQAGMEQGIYAEDEYRLLLLEIVLKHGLLNNLED